MADEVFAREDHVIFFSEMLRKLPAEYEGLDENRITLGYFAVSALDILDAIDQVSVSEVVEWVYSLQILPEQLTDGNAGPTYGFRASSSIGIPFSSEGSPLWMHDGGHIAMTYSALAILHILGDDLSRVHRSTILSSIRQLQQPDGSFNSIHFGAERDLRFSFCAAAICMMLGDWSGMDVNLAVEYLMNSQSYDEGFGLSPGLESHGGATYCALAALTLMKERSRVSEGAIRWLSQRQVASGGFQGRINKDADSCYAFWVGGSLDIMEEFDLCDKAALRSFLVRCQNKWGGMSKHPDGVWADLLHSYYGICGFSLINEPGLNPLCCYLGITTRAATRILQIQ